MKKAALAAALIVAACGQGVQAPQEQSPVVSAPAPTAAPAAPAPAGETMGADAVEACFLTAAHVSAALGGGYGDGVASNESAPYLKTCEYRGADTDLRISVYWHDPTMLQSPLSAMLGANPEPVAGDPDGALFEPPAATGGCTRAYRRAHVTYNVQIISCRALSDARERLLRLPRP